jgi:hypothetical protein
MESDQGASSVSVIRIDIVPWNGYPVVISRPTERSLSNFVEIRQSANWWICKPPPSTVAR